MDKEIQEENTQGGLGPRTFKTHLLELLNELDSESPNSPLGTLNVNTASITEIVEPMSAKQETAAPRDCRGNCL